MSHSPSSVRAVVSESEWEQRLQLAACYRLVALFGWDDCDLPVGVLDSQKN